MTHSRASKPLARVLFIALIGISVTVIILSLLVMFTWTKGDPIGGYRFFNVISRSMDGMIDKGSMIIVKEASAGSLSVGDVITYYENLDATTPITHQIVEIVTGENGQDSYITKGTNNQVADPYLVNADMILGRVVFSMPIAGSVLSFIDTNLYYIFAGALITGTAAFLFLIPLIEKENERRHRIKGKRAYLIDIESRLASRIYGPEAGFEGATYVAGQEVTQDVTQDLYLLGENGEADPGKDLWRGRFIRDLGVESGS
jgi:signal peptidase